MAVVRRYAHPLSRKEFVAMAILASTDVCILWPYETAHNGYALSNATQERRVHREVCRQVHGSPPFSRAVAMHSCNVPACINPRHLSWGSQKQNLAQARAQGRMKRVVRSGGGPRGRKRGKLSDDDVHTIRLATETLAVIGARFGVSAAYVWDIKHGRRYAYVPDAA